MTTPLQSEVDLLLPLGDHQHSTRVVLAHDASDATYVRQSIDYAQFGRVTAILGANGLANATGVVTAFAHHGSLLDTATGLQLKGERWYSPDLGRFVSEDPIQEGTNWFMAYGNDPVNYADPSGLSQQGYPLTRLPATTTFGGFVGAGLGSGILSSGLVPGAGLSAPSVGSIASYQAAAPRINQRELATYGGQVDAYRAQQASINAQLAAAKGSLANRSFYELYDKSADRARIDALANQLVDVNGRLSAARSNYTQVLNGGGGQRSTYAGYQYESVGGAALSGLQTGGKAVGNSFASAGTLGFYEGPFGVTQRDLDNGYATSRLIAGASAELLVGVATGGAARLGAAGGRAALLGKTALAFDAGGNAVGVGRGVVDAYQQGGLTFGNSVQIAGGAFGLGGNVAAGGRQLGELISDAGRVRVGLDANVLSSPQLNSGGAFNAIKIYMAPKKATAAYEALVTEAKLKYPNKAGRPELHHVDPVYLGGAKSGVRVELDAAYHQLITNKFRELHPYGSGPLSVASRQVILNKVYSQLPLPPGK